MFGRGASWTNPVCIITEVPTLCSPRGQGSNVPGLPASNRKRPCDCMIPRLWSFLWLSRQDRASYKGSTLASFLVPIFLSSPTWWFICRSCCPSLGDSRITVGSPSPKSDKTVPIEHALGHHGGRRDFAGLEWVPVTLGSWVICVRSPSFHPVSLAASPHFGSQTPCLASTRPDSTYPSPRMPSH